MLNKISFMLDDIANKLESKGLVKEAFEIDKIADEMDKVAFGEVEDDIDKLISYLETQVYQPGTHYPAQRSDQGNYWVNEHTVHPDSFDSYLPVVGRFLLGGNILQRIYSAETGEFYKGTNEQFNKSKDLFLDLLKTSKRLRPIIDKISKIVDEVRPRIESQG